MEEAHAVFSFCTCLWESSARVLYLRANVTQHSLVEGSVRPHYFLARPGEERGGVQVAEPTTSALPELAAAKLS